MGLRPEPTALRKRSPWEKLFCLSFGLLIPPECISSRQVHRKDRQTRRRISSHQPGNRRVNAADRPTFGGKPVLDFDERLPEMDHGHTLGSQFSLLGSGVGSVIELWSVSLVLGFYQRGKPLAAAWLDLRSARRLSLSPERTLPPQNADHTSLPDAREPRLTQRVKLCSHQCRA
ncbi:hypothetical protein NHX12_001273 [Muraenolepis orangiensis]|uniref:Uncharacterized protein n=1 Tax=Muraenolepis orangiensis TaxID=630683 RepID=A0A9Q0E055_9TELE|nr:hypothetical protein NHX12_001273 [Muraenolepis orangiensis]